MAVSLKENNFKCLLHIRRCNMHSKQVPSVKGSEIWQYNSNSFQTVTKEEPILRYASCLIFWFPYLCDGRSSLSLSWFPVGLITACLTVTLCCFYIFTTCIRAANRFKIAFGLILKRVMDRHSKKLFNCNRPGSNQISL